MKGIVDRFEGDFVVVEIDGATKDIAKAEVEDNVKAGDCVVYLDGKWMVDNEETKNRLNEIKKLMDDIWED